MYRIIDNRGTGKTKKLIQKASEIGSTIVCSNPTAMRNKSIAYGITGVNFISYPDYIQNHMFETGSYLIDEIDMFLPNNIQGYSISNED